MNKKNQHPSDRKTVFLQGGLGNQLFQYAFGLYLQQKMGSQVRYSSAFLQVRMPNRTPRKFALQFLESEVCFLHPSFFFGSVLFYTYLLLKKIGLLSSFGVSWENATTIENRTFYVGNWQKLEYLQPISDVVAKNIRSGFKFSDKAQKMADKIHDAGNSVSVHVRRGDYLSNPLAAGIYTLCGAEYYHQALSAIHAKGAVDKVFVFSDDLEWCQKNLHFPMTTEFVSFPQENPMNEILLMAECRNNVIANSSFSWWGAFLNPHPAKIVVSPKNWFQDHQPNPQILPSDWLLL